MLDTRSTAEWVANRASEPVLDTKNIQGNIVPGFNKDFQVLLFLKIDNVQHFKRWLGTLSFTTMEEVLSFRRLRKEEEQSGRPLTKTTWRNIAFSSSALMQLGVLNTNNFTSQAFGEGLWPRSERLGDPKGQREGSPTTWVVGGPGNEADILLIIASDCLIDLYSEVARIEDTIYAYVLPRTYEETPAPSGARIIFKQHGANLPQPLAGHEHFGFRDGISQPGVRGRVTNNRIPAKEDYLTPCENSDVEDEGKPGQKLVWPGEFVFGYPKQALKNFLQAGDTIDQEFTKNGSFLVFRRLRQDVGAFHRFLHKNAEQYGFTAEHFGAMCVGRRASGDSIFSNIGTNGEKGPQDKSLVNAFEFQKDEVDPKGEVCPFAAHIRRTNPRDDVDKNEVQTHRLLRRGIPYGRPSSSTFTKPEDDMIDRGLLFIAYQTSIENQFEHMQKVANNPWFREGEEAGYDPIIGQNNRGRPRKFRIISKDGQSESVALPMNGWVIPTGGGYFFAPSIKVVEQVLAQIR